MSSHAYLFAAVALLAVPACMEEVPDTEEAQLEVRAEKVTICHVPPGNPSNAHTISVGAPAVSAHLAHGDHVGACAPACEAEPEICGDGLDQDCDGVADDGCCAATPEVCDGADNDCDGVVDEGCIGERVWNDLDQDGLQSEGEPGVAGATLMLRTTAGALVSVAVSDADGTYWFSGAPAGEYYIEAAPPAGYNYATKDAGDDTLDSDFDMDTSATDSFDYDGAARSDLDLGLRFFTET